jgi:hypothetical protein
VLGLVFVCWIVVLINSSFDVDLEEPQDSICFWAVMGLGVAAVRLSREASTRILRPAAGQQDMVTPRPASANSASVPGLA